MGTAARANKRPAAARAQRRTTCKTHKSHTKSPRDSHTQSAAVLPGGSCGLPVTDTGGTDGAVCSRSQLFLPREKFSSRCSCCSCCSSPLTPHVSSIRSSCCSAVTPPTWNQSNGAAWHRPATAGQASGSTGAHTSGSRCHNKITFSESGLSNSFCSLIRMDNTVLNK